MFLCISARAGSLGTEVYIDILGAPEVMVEGSHDQLRYRAWRAFHKNAAWQEAAIPAWIDFNNEPDPTTGAAAEKAVLSQDIGAVGIELHPADGVLYACTSNVLWRVDVADGTVTEIGEISADVCNNLAAPYTKVSCPDWPE